MFGRFTTRTRVLLIAAVIVAVCVAALTYMRMWEVFFKSLQTYESVAIWLEGIALVFIFIWDRLDSSEEQKEVLAQLAVSQKQADALINSERAWVMAQIEGDKAKWADRKVHIVLGSGTGGDSTGTWIVLSCHNEGKSPGWIYEKRVKFEVVSKVNPTPDFDSLPIVFEGREPIGIGQTAIPNVTNLHRLETAMGHAKSGDMMLIYGIVKYQDIFKEKRTVTFGYRITQGDRDYTFERLSEARYNENT